MVLDVELKDVKNLKIIPPQGMKSALKLEVGGIRSIRARIGDLKSGYSFGGMSLMPRE